MNNDSESANLRIVRTSIRFITIIALLFAVLGTSHQNVSAASKGQQILFMSNQKITYLAIDGTNQYGKSAYWSKSWSNGTSSATTKDWWWLGTVVITFKLSGKSTYTQCVIDYIGEGSSVALITYNGGYGCGGDRGNAKDPLKSAGQAWINQLVWKDEPKSSRLFGEFTFAQDGWKCFWGLYVGKIDSACVGVSNELLKWAVENKAK